MVREAERYMIRRRLLVALALILAAVGVAWFLQPEKAPAQWTKVQVGMPWRRAMELLGAPTKRFTETLTTISDIQALERAHGFSLLEQKLGIGKTVEVWVYLGYSDYDVHWTSILLAPNGSHDGELLVTELKNVTIKRGLLERIKRALAKFVEG